MKILIDPGHGHNTPGKCSPDKTFYEWIFNRKIASSLVERLKDLGYDAERIVTGENDISLLERCLRVNAWCSKLGKKNVLLVSIHANAAGNGGWHTARGWSVYVAKNCSAASKILAQSLFAAADARGLRGNRSIPSEHYWQANFTIISRTNCPAVLTENLFYDNREDLAILKSEDGERQIVELHVEGIINYLAANG